MVKKRVVNYDSVSKIVCRRDIWRGGKVKIGSAIIFHHQYPLDMKREYRFFGVDCIDEYKAEFFFSFGGGRDGLQEIISATGETPREAVKAALMEARKREVFIAGDSFVDENQSPDETPDAMTAWLGAARETARLKSTPPNNRGDG